MEEKIIDIILNKIGREAIVLNLMFYNLRKG